MRNLSPDGPSEPWTPLNGPALRFLQQTERFQGPSIAAECRRTLTGLFSNGTSAFDWKDAEVIRERARSAVIERWGRQNEAPVPPADIDQLMELERSGIWTGLTA